MSSSLVTSYWFRFAFPIILLCALWFGMNNVILVTRSNLGFAGNLPYVLFIAAIAIAHLFKQSRMAMVASAMLICYWVIQYRLQTPLSSGSTLLELSLLAILLPVACLLSYAFKNGGLFSRGFATYLGILAMFGVWCFLIITQYESGGFAQLSEGLLYSVDQVSKLPFILVLYLAALVGVTSIFVLTKNRLMDVVIYTSILLAANTFIFFQIQYVSSTMFSLAGVLLILYLLSASYEMAFNDRLTQLPGRHALELDMRHLGRKFTVAMVDVDHFKSFNDSYGHETGDDVLKLVAARLRMVQGRAKVYRYGGEEFTVLFKGKTAEQAMDYLELLRADIEAYDLVIRNLESRPKNDKDGAKQRSDSKRMSVNITVSIGLCDSTLQRDPNEALKFADQALYAAKKAGRNCVKNAG
ncbi:MULTISPECIES: GGDEF domain-containing protein [Vibrio]|uniref:GGDEF domain-containing protein n=1 Tax=Vibrio TaxID=662 RepID=UPI00056F0E8D|nr:GGDEF domain-containing protein [Vibrio furnissii]MCG6211386.1 GGDEF domain-containing protein [Vibrio furnissii]MCG6228658.1 GGDEF domain-containing protein [Vibrio furnissii]UHJ63425.1 GGDEF domain-containing protein [Vibrio furnissii]UON51085.1 GGDEF domain-containing protein [Vibrio furnissii]SUQ33414.1 diguanylate cyclase [Vibrio furnissii]